MQVQHRLVEGEQHVSIDTEIISTDHKLSERAEKASLELFKLRWHWTTNSDNPHRVSAAEYAKAVGKSETLIRNHAKAYTTWLENQSVSLAEHAQRANMSTQMQAAVEKIAEIYSVSFSTARSSYSQQVQQLREAAIATATNRDLPYDEALDYNAKFMAESAVRRQEDRRRLREQPGLRYISAEAKLTRARDEIISVINELRDVELSDQERQFLQEALRRVVAATQLADVAMGAANSNTDWDAELARIAG